MPPSQIKDFSNFFKKLRVNNQTHFFLVRHIFIKGLHELVPPQTSEATEGILLKVSTYH
jgi:hypothetical protein